MSAAIKGLLRLITPFHGIYHPTATDWTRTLNTGTFSPFLFPSNAKISEVHDCFGKHIGMILWQPLTLYTLSINSGSDLNAQESLTSGIVQFRFFADDVTESFIQFHHTFLPTLLGLETMRSQAESIPGYIEQ